MAVKEETHAARWGLLRGYSGNATKWVDFVVTDSTRRESCHLFRVVRSEGISQGEIGGKAGYGAGSFQGTENCRAPGRRKVGPARSADLRLEGNKNL